MTEFENDYLSFAASNQERLNFNYLNMIKNFTNYTHKDLVSFEELDAIERNKPEYKKLQSKLDNSRIEDDYIIFNAIIGVYDIENQNVNMVNNKCKKDMVSEGIYEQADKKIPLVLNHTLNDTEMSERNIGYVTNIKLEEGHFVTAELQMNPIGVIMMLKYNMNSISIGTQNIIAVNRGYRFISNYGLVEQRTIIPFSKTESTIEHVALTGNGLTACGFGTGVFDQHAKGNFFKDTFRKNRYIKWAEDRLEKDEFYFDIYGYNNFDFIDLDIEYIA